MGEHIGGNELMSSPTTTSLDALQNSGVSIINMNVANDAECRTIIALGVPRSGTSMIASSLRTMGIFIGNKADNSVHEDVDIAQAIEKGEINNLLQIIKERDASYAVWGFKRPTVFKKISPLLRHFRNPRFVVTFRDPLAIAKRNEISMHESLTEALKAASRETMELANFVSDVEIPTLLISYEKALQKPKEYVYTLSQFCGVTLTPEIEEQVLSTIGNGPAGYLNSSRIKFEGSIDQLRHDGAKGWARIIGRPGPQVITARFDGRSIGSSVANQFRPDLQKANKGDGRCAFEMDFREPVDDLSKVSFEVQGTNFIFKKKIVS
jgi:hypothetical protein